MRDFLRSLPVFGGLLTELDPDTVPAGPHDLFTQWLHDAVEAGVPEPHAMTLSTCDPDGTPDARVLILKDLDERGWWFASNAASAKGQQLASRSSAALSFYWPQLGRQVRIRGPVTTGTPAQNATDFRARATTARAVALAGHESQPLRDRADCLDAVDTARAQLARDPDLVSPTWTTYAVGARTVEFWQADKDRLHTRIQYQRDDATTWRRRLLWP
jgi:pyridoxamine 5'-phosphate oxidase